MAVNGPALAAGGVGVVLLWSGLHNASILTSIQDIVQGKKPQPGPNPTVGQIGSTGTPTGGTITTVPGGKTVSPFQAYTALLQAGASPTAAVTLTAIGGAESGWNVDALNNDPSTGDYSVGVWQINYYGDLMGPRTAEFGSPASLIGNLSAQASAAVTLWRQSGFSPWTTYTRGTYQAYLPQALAAAGGP